jgi:pimeloyl-ACP methyl ester carboxylesterase
MSVKVMGSHVHLVDEGSGPTCLFLHGNPDSADMWKPIIAELKAKFRCLAPDLPGFGRSEVPADYDCSLETMASWVNVLLNSTGVTDRVTLVCHDFGGPYGLAWAIKNPDRVERIVVMNTAFHSSYRWHFWGRVWRTPILGELSQALLSRALFVREMRRGSRHLTTEHLNAVYDLITPRMKAMVLKLYRASDPERIASWEVPLRALTASVPTLVLWGDRDPFIPAEFADKFGPATVRHFSEYGHFIAAEAPALVAREILSFSNA